MALPANPQRILIVCMRRLGDALLATAPIRSVRRAWPHARLEVLVNAESAAALEGNPDIQRLWVQPERGSKRQTLRLVGALWRRFDLAVSVLYSDRPHLWTWVASANRAGVVPPHGHVGARLKRWLTQAWCELELGKVHALEQYLRIADALHIARVHEVVPPRPSRGALDTTERAYAVLHPSPGYAYKAWTGEGWRALVRHLIARGFAVRLTGGPAQPEFALLRTIVAGLNEDERVHVSDLGGLLSFAELTPLIERARLYVGPDTSVTHLAAATGTPTIALFGPSHPIAWGPWPMRWQGGKAGSPWQMKAPLQRRGNVWLVQGEGGCVPCLQEGCDRHPASYARCLEDLNAARVIEVVDAVLAEADRGVFNVRAGARALA